MSITYTRLLDIFLLGPLKIYISFYTKNMFIKIFMLIIGTLTILFNAHNFLLFDIKIIKEPWFIFKPFITQNNGKTQKVRLLDLLIMYPLLIYINLFIELPNTIKFYLSLNNIFGIIYNLMNFIFVYMIETKKKKYKKYIKFYNKYLFF